MFGGLYGDLPQAKTSNDGEASAPTKASTGWALNKMAAAPPRTAAHLAPPSVLRAGRGRGRAVPAGRGRGPGMTPLGGPSPRPVLDPLGKTNAAPSLSSITGAPIQDEYDPARPNDYEEVRRERERQRIEAEQEVERLRQLEAQKAEEERLREHRDKEAAMAAALAEAQQQQMEDRRAALGMSGEEAFLRRGRMKSSGFSDSAGPGPALPDSSAAPSAGGLSAAAKMMQKMGWKEGQGLGKAAQGMVTPLIAQKTDTRSAVIVNAPQPAGMGVGGGAQGGPPVEDPAAAAAKRARISASLAGPKSKVVLLRNMIGPGEVDDALEDEVGEECSKYGNVNSVLIFEATAPNFPAEEAVRIFVEFDGEAAATKTINPPWVIMTPALIELEGRYFGGRNVRATFFEQDRFDANDLAPRPEEIGA